ncbi:hypothetical protein XELAEV_18004571mg [Xenopus laevis]|nr:hypothetical protein XELAEV_18004571mg [Xenopus laevis]
MDSRLHKPMYFFLSNLSFLDMCYSSVTVPKTLANFLSSKKTIYFWGCAIQLFFLTTLVCAEAFLLSVMAYDRYVAICKPLFYHIIMDYRMCLSLALASWLTALLNGITHTTLTFRLSFCSHKINHFLCEIPQLLLLSCTFPLINEVMLIIFAGIISVSTLLLIITSYTFIISSISKIPSAESRRKTFSTCSSHFIVVTILYGSAMFFYLRPSTDVSLNRDKVISVVYTVITPLLNPLIYSFRNTEVKRAFQNVFLRRGAI